MGTAVSLDPFADMAPLMPEPSWPAADLVSTAEAPQPGRAAGEAVAVAIPAAAGLSSPSGGSDDGFGSFNEASEPGSLFPTSVAAAPGDVHLNYLCQPSIIIDFLFRMEQR